MQKRLEITTDDVEIQGLVAQMIAVETNKPAQRRNSDEGKVTLSGVMSLQAATTLAQQANQHFGGKVKILLANPSTTYRPGPAVAVCDIDPALG